MSSGKKSEDYYWKSVVFQVEECLFRVPRFHFEKSSEVFSDMFSLPQAESEEGESDAHPIRLEGIEAKDFECLLKFLYPRNLLEKEEPATRRQWISVLKLATLWQFLDLRALAIDKLTHFPMNASDRVVLGRNYHVHAWLRSGYVDLVKQLQTPSTGDVEKIGYLPATRVFRLREEIRKRYRKKKTTHVPAVTKKFDFQCANCNVYDNQACRAMCPDCAKLINTSDYGLILPSSEVEKAVDKEFESELSDVQV
ncbi:hypothetical protein VKT23_007918 [Stygiomarasmius scandens]|uniref:BTB domain-containing protein n=1 Tax=Marasmiellus scandens TaxID=2682957 RepID=A0ABR1JJL4_9AGAR